MIRESCVLPRQLIFFSFDLLAAAGRRVKVQSFKDGYLSSTPFYNQIKLTDACI